MKALTFDRKMIRFVTWSLIIATAVIILVSAASTVSSLTSKSTQMARKEVEVMAANTEDNFEQYYSLIWSLMLDRHIQNYLRAPENQYDYFGDAVGVLDNVCNMWGNINFICIIPEDGSRQLVKGSAIPNWLPDYQSKLMQSYLDSPVIGKNVMRMTYNRNFNVKGEYTLSIFYPVYSSSVIGLQLGTMCINVNDSSLSQVLATASGTGQFAVDTYLVHESGMIMAAGESERIGTEFGEIAFTEKQNVTSTWGSVWIYKKLERWDFYYVTRIAWWSLLKDSVWTVAALGILLTLLIVITVQLARQMVTQAYRPWGNVVKAMGRVSQGEMETRLTVLEEDPDMRVVTSGFNGMMEQLIKLMEQVKEEQYQLDQIKLEALHSQIQPHFLYNTLDCIHWQAVVDGNKDISSLVKALASYYRICLSKGKDIITLKEELEYTKNYLYIQQMRYGEVLEYGVEPAPELEKALIPKLTLQPLVENALYHGIKLSENKKGYIAVRVSGNKEQVEIEVADDGIGMTEEAVTEMNQLIQKYDEQFGYGVRNVNRRIQLYYGEKYGLHYRRNDSGGVTVKVVLPYAEECKGRQAIL